MHERVPSAGEPLAGCSVDDSRRFSPLRSAGVAESADTDRGLVIAVPTFKRPQELAELLPALVDEIGLASSAYPGLCARILIVDNDPERSAETLVATYDAPMVQYSAQPRPGIAAARNRALDLSADYDLLAFIDDDERPVRGWLRHLVQTQASTGAVLVAGAVIPDYETQVDPWIEAGRFFYRRRLMTGTVLDVAAAGNLLLDLRAIRSLGLRFEDKFGLSGGEDTLFSRRLAEMGPWMVWCDEAIVVDRVPASRMTRAWVLTRAMSSGNSWALTSLELVQGARSRAAVRLGQIGRGTARISFGISRFAYGWLIGSMVHQARGLRTAARGFGLVLGSIGYVYQEYSRHALKAWPWRLRRI